MQADLSSDTPIRNYRARITVSVTADNCTSQSLFPDAEETVALQMNKIFNYFPSYELTLVGVGRWNWLTLVLGRPTNMDLSMIRT